MLGQISEQNAPAKTEYILHIVSKFSTKGKESANFGAKVEQEKRKKKERKKKEKRKE